MLPGQFVNVLNVPMQFSSGHRRQRNASVSSTSSEVRTMNPEDKYLNPRPAPRPALCHLDTSEGQKSALNLESSPFTLSPASGRYLHGRNASLPSSLISLRSFRLPRKASNDDRARSTSPTHARVTGLRAAFRQIGPAKAIDADTIVDRGRASSPHSHREHLSSEQARKSDRAAADWLNQPKTSESLRPSSRSRSAAPTTERDLRETQTKTLALRRSVEQLHDGELALSIPSFQSHRRQRSRSREPSPLRKSSVAPENPKREYVMPDAGSLQYKPLATLKEVVSPQNTSTWPSLGANASTDKPYLADSISEVIGKCLPTIPKTPSSALVLTGIPKEMPEKISKELDDSQSSLSNTTPGNEYPSSTDKSHFSHWTSNTASSFSSSQWSSVFLDGKSPSFIQGKGGPSSQPASPWEMTGSAQSPAHAERRKSSSMLDANRMPSIISSSTVSSYDNTSPSSPTSETSDSMVPLEKEPTSLQKRYGMMLGNFSNYKLPVGAQDSVSTVQYPLPDTTGDRPSKDSHKQFVKRDLPDAVTEDVPHFNNMQQFLHELSYLGEIIQR